MGLPWAPETPVVGKGSRIPNRLDFRFLPVDLTVGRTNFAPVMRVFIMKMTLKRFALAIATILGGAGLADAQDVGRYQLPPGPYQSAVAPVGYMDAASCVDGCTAKGGAANCHDGSCTECRDPTGIWGGVEFVFLFPKGRDLPALVTTATAATPPSDAGALGFPNTSILYGADRVGDQFQAAGRITVGKWFDEEESIGLGVRFLGTEGDRGRFNLSSDENPIIARPFFNNDPLVNQQDALLIAYPGLTTGNIAVATSSDMYNLDVLGRVNLDFGSNYRLDLIGGYQNTRLDDGVAISSLSTVVGGNLPLGSTYRFQDSFDARNIFNGGSLGLWYEHYRGPWVISAMGKFSVGQMSETIRIRGTNTADTGGGPVTGPGGLLAQPTNIGTYHRKETGFVPEFALNLNRRLTDHLDLTVGYSIMYFNSVVLAGDQIDTTVNGSQIQNGPLVGPASPAFNGFNDTDYFVHGLTLGLGFHF